MRSALHELYPAVRSEGGLLSPDLLSNLSGGKQDFPGTKPEDYHLLKGERLGEATAQSWNRMRSAWASFQSRLRETTPGDPATSLTRERFLLVMFQELQYGRLPTSPAVDLDGRSYPISHFWQHSPIHLLGCNVNIDKKSPGVAGAARMSPHGMLQEFLNRSEEHLWAFLSNGLRLRILRDSRRLTRQAYVEFDLEVIFEGELYPDFVLLWMLCHQSRVESEKPEECWLEKWSELGYEQGTRALDVLRKGVEEAISALGRGFISHLGNAKLREDLRSGKLTTQDYYRQILRLVYRLIFLFVTEDRGLLLNPGASIEAKERYSRHYSTVRLRSIAEKIRGTAHADLYCGLRTVMYLLGDLGHPELGLPPLGSYLWSRESVQDLAKSDIANRDLLEAVRSLAFTRRERSLWRVDFRNLGVEELGSVYESLLEFHPDLNLDAGTFELRIAAGHERKTTGSYYTRPGLVQSLLDTALEPVLDDAARSPDPEKAILAFTDLRSRLRLGPLSHRRRSPYCETPGFRAYRR